MFRLCGFLIVSKAIGLDEVSSARLPDEAAKRLRRPEIRGAIEPARVFVIGNTLFAPVLGFQVWNIGVNVLAITWTATMLAFLWWPLWTRLSSYETDRRHGSGACKFTDAWFSYPQDAGPMDRVFWPAVMR